MASTNSLLWNLRRFGLTPAGLISRIVPGDRPRVVCISIPKAGTHLLERVLCRLPGMYRPVVPTLHADNIEGLGGLSAVLGRSGPGSVLLTHLHWTAATEAAISEAGACAAFLVRDPRAIVVSQAAFIPTQPRHPQYAVFAALPGLRERVLVAIRGNAATNFLSIAERLRAFHGWLGSSAHIVRFEELVGERGGGSARAQREAVERLLEAARLRVDATSLEAILASAFSAASPTFRRGSIDAWREVFDDEISRVFEETTAAEAASFGYAG